MVYQLAKTTPYIGGQIRLDLVVHRQPEGSEHHELIDEVHVVPLSDSIIYNDNPDYPTLNYSHLDNIRHLYNIIGDDMFKNFSVFNNPHKWLYNNKKYKIDTYDHTYELGMKRMRYSRYNKQFSYFTPMWNTEPGISDLWFKFKIHDGIEDGDSHGHPDFINAGYGLHMTDAVKNYILDYISHTDDQVMSMKFGTYEAWIDGVYAPSGTLMSKDIEYTLTSILSREYTLMEFDYLLDSAWLTNKMIAKQLINFNIVFDIEDILPPEYNEYINDPHNNFFNVDVDIMYSVNKAGVEDKKYRSAEYKDIYSNYESIPGFNTSTSIGVRGGYDASKNVLEYIQDYTVKDLVYMNKVTQPITHWAISENLDYTFNMYNGFSPYNGNLDERGTGMFYNQPDLTLDTYSPISCNLLWTDVYDYRHNDIGMALAKSLPSNADIPYIDTHNKDIVWYHNVKYNTSDFKEKGFAVSIFIVDNIQYEEGEEFVVLYKEGANTYHTIVYIKDSPYPIFRIITDEVGLDYATFSKVSSIKPSEATGDNSDWLITQYGILQSFLQCAEKPYSITLPSTYELGLSEAPTHIPATTETDLYLVNEPVTLYRYSGNLMPQFIKTEVLEIPHINRVYHYIQWWKDDDSNTCYSDGNLSVKEYNDMLNTGFPAEYPSIDYYALNKDHDGVIGEELDVNAIPGLYKEYDSYSDTYNYWDEFVWFKKSRVKVLRPTEVICITVSDASSKTEDELDNIFWTLLYKLVWGETAVYDDKRMDFLKEHYSMYLTFEYTSLESLDSIDYTLTFKLK